MLLVNVEDVLKLTNSNVRYENGTNNDKCIFFDTDKFLGNLDTAPKGTFITPDMLAEIFRHSFTEGYIDYNRD